MINPVAAAKRLTHALKGRWCGDYGLCLCPAHADRRPSLSITPGHSAVLFHCFAGCPSATVIEAVRQLRINGAIPTLPNNRATIRRDMRPLARQLWDEGGTVGGTPGGAYLMRRGIAHIADSTRYHPRTITKIEGRRVALPALLVPLHNEQGLAAVQRIFVTPEGAKAPVPEPKMLLGLADDAAVRIGTPETTLHLAEGIEDAGAVVALGRAPFCWAVCGINRYGKVFIPPQVRSIIIWSQHGAEPVQALKRARPHLTVGGRQLEVRLPPRGGDWNDLLCEQRANG